ncbi:MAG: TIGR02186 family protein [Hyphomicrobium sp.]
MRKAIVAVLLSCSFVTVAVCGGASAAPTDPPRETVEADVSTRSVAITSGFTGTEIIIFGTVENSRQPSAEAGTYDVVVVVEGTPAPVVVRKKARVGGLWINSSSVRFASFPSYYAIASTRPIDEISDAEVLNKNEIGFNHIRMVPSGRAYIGTANPKDAIEFREAVIRLKQRDRLYLTADYGVTFIGRSLFRSTITLPPNVPVGPLTARVYLLKDGQLLSSYISKVTMERAGLERFLHDAAYERPLLYGLAMIAMAAMAGLAAAFAFSRATA